MADSRTLAFFGATGGCANACLAAALTAGYKCSALVRIPSKLRGMLLARSIGEAVVSSHLKIVEGDVRDLDSVKEVLEGADVIVSGVGAYPVFQWSFRKPLVATDNTICTDAVKTILRACQELKAEKTPMLVVISTAGVQERGKPHALPLAYLPWYNWLLADPLADKVAMEDAIITHSRLDEKERAIAGFVVVKPSILTGGNVGKVEDVRAGTGDRPPVGYSIDREMLGLWMFRRLVEEDGMNARWKDQRVTVTY
jgi:nucleoside-diphosphate-sugar epimerase